ncbi:MAG TPA: aminotransferase class III-fold pyridoxal phosphate-dependent enzyme [Solirubrobacteraceae bacterium]
MNDPLHPAPIADSLGVTADAAARTDETLALAARHLDPSLVDVLRILGFDENYASAQGSYLYDSAGRAYLDFHTGEGFSSLGHNHPDVREVLHATLAADLVDGVQIHYSPLAGMLAQELSRRLPQGLNAVFFASTGAEAVDSAMKFARAATRRPRLISCDNGFHGVTLGPLSLVGDEFFKEGFAPLLPGCERVAFGDLDRLEAQLRAKDVAAFIVEPIQGRMVTLPPEGYLQGAQELCRRYGTMFVLDEIQTGLGRTGSWFALEHWGLQPDFVLVGKALSGGYMPVAAMVTRREIYQKAVGALERSYVHQSTYGRNRLSMAAGLATLRIIERDRLVEHAARMSAVLLGGLAELQERYEMIKEVRASGLMIGIELGPPSSRAARLNWRLIHMASEGLFPQLIVIPLHRDHGVITMAAGKNDVIKLLPPLTLSEDEARSFLGALDSVLADCHGAASKNWGVVREIATATLRRRAPQPATVPASASEQIRSRGKPVDRSRDDVCLITGASGFVGGRLAQRLVREGHPVRCLVRASSDTSPLDGLDVEIAVGDLTNAGSLARAVDGCDYVFHCGALVSDWATRQEIEQTNVQGTRSLLDAAADAKVRRFVHFSTTDVYGYPDRAGIDETYAATRFRNWYAETKLKAEAEVRRAEQARGLDAVILRPATVYGPGSVEVVGEIARAIRARNMLLVDKGRAVAGLCYVDNLLDAAVLALGHDGARGHAFNVTDGLGVTWREFTDGLAEGLGCASVRWSVPYWMANGIGFSLEHGYRLLRRTTGLHAAPLLSRQAVHVLGNSHDFSNRRAREMLGWEPRVEYPDGLQATLDWLTSEYFKRA